MDTMIGPEPVSLAWSIVAALLGVVLFVYAMRGVRK